MSGRKLYFNGITPKGKYLTQPISEEELGKRLQKTGLDAPPEWVLKWTQEHAVADPRRKPILETKRPWDLKETGWAVVFAPDIDPRVRTALGKLLEHRSKLVGRKKSYFKDRTYKKGQTAEEFLEERRANPRMPADPDHFPYYVLLVGDPASLPYKFQSELDVNYAVGRVFFKNVEDYAAYAASVVRAETNPRRRSQEAVFFGTEHAKDQSTRRTSKDLVRKLAKKVLEPRMPWEVRQVLGEEAKKENLREILGGSRTPAFLFAACHGMGFEYDELDGEEDRQEDCQGALVCQDWPGPASGEGVGDDQWFAASDVPEKASLHGLIAFFYACYGLGTPHRNNFDPAPVGKPRPIAPRALVSRLPQELLRRPEGGALAVIGHVDQSWVTSFAGSPKGEGIDAFLYGIRRLLQGHTVGWAMEYINQSFATIAMMHDSRKEDQHNREPVDLQRLARQWLIRNDVRNFMVFGDPAVRLPGLREPR